MLKKKAKPKKGCITCKYLNCDLKECAHPQALTMQEALYNCLETNKWAWWKEKVNPVKDLLDNIDDGIELNEEGE